MAVLVFYHLNNFDSVQPVQTLLLRELLRRV